MFELCFNSLRRWLLAANTPRPWHSLMIRKGRNKTVLLYEFRTVFCACNYFVSMTQRLDAERYSYYLCILCSYKGSKEIAHGLHILHPMLDL
jgi:hypothetical protein